MRCTAKKHLLPTNILASPLAVHLVNVAQAKNGIAERPQIISGSHGQPQIWKVGMCQGDAVDASVGCPKVQSQSLLSKGSLACQKAPGLAMKGLIRV